MTSFGSCGFAPGFVWQPDEKKSACLQDRSSFLTGTGSGWVPTGRLGLENVRSYLLAASIRRCGHEASAQPPHSAVITTILYRTVYPDYPAQKTLFCYDLVEDKDIFMVCVKDNVNFCFADVGSSMTVRRLLQATSPFASGVWTTCRCVIAT
jgi:hypothetical protein